MRELNPFKNEMETYTAFFKGSRKMTDYSVGKIDDKFVGRASRVCQNRKVSGGYVISIRDKEKLIFFDKDGQIPKSLCKKYNLGELF